MSHFTRFWYSSQVCRASDFFSRLVGRSDPWSKKWQVIFWNDGPKHIKLTTVDIFVIYFTYSTLTADDTVKPFLSDHWKQKTNYRLMRVKSIAECSKGSILQYFWPALSYHLLFRSLFFVFFEWLLKICFTVLTTYMYFLFCGVFLLKWDFFTTKKDESTGSTALESYGPYFEIMGQWPGPTINLKAWMCMINVLKFRKHISFSILK